MLRYERSANEERHRWTLAAGADHHGLRSVEIVVWWDPYDDNDDIDFPWLWLVIADGETRRSAAREEHDAIAYAFEALSRIVRRDETDEQLLARARSQT